MNSRRLYNQPAATAVLAAVAVAWCTPADTRIEVQAADPGDIELVLDGSVAVPLSFEKDIALVAEDTACVGNSFTFQVHCVARDGDLVGMFGREGDGPGEFRTVAWIERATVGVGVLDPQSNRLTSLDMNGNLLNEVTLPGGFLGYQLVGDRIFGVTRDYGEQDPSQTSEALRQGDVEAMNRLMARWYVPTAVDAESGEAVWSRSDVTDPENTDCLVVPSLSMTPLRGLVGWTCNDELMVFEDRDGSGRSVRSPAYVAEMPGERDVDEFLDGMRRIGGGTAAMSMPQSLKDAYTADYRSTPKRWYREAGLTFQFDGQGRTWAATTRDRDVHSYIEVWNGAEYLGTARIRDRLMGFDVLGNTLVALVERAPNRDGISERAIDWYHIGSIPSQPSTP